MKLHGLRMTNFKAYRDGPHELRFDCPPGLYHVQGVNNVALDMDGNGAAKSTIFDAIAWCLYGKTLRDQRPGASVEPWSGEKGTEVGLEFSLSAGGAHRLLRGRKPNRLLLSTLEFENGWSEYRDCDQKTIDKLLPLSYEAFVCTVVLPQFGERFLDMRPEDQSRLFSETLDLDVWLRAADTAHDLERAAREQIERGERDAERLMGIVDTLRSSLTHETARAESFATWQAEDICKQEELVKEIEREARLVCRVKKPSDNEETKARNWVRECKNVYDYHVSELSDVRHKLCALVEEERRTTASLAAYARAPRTCPECGQTVGAEHSKDKTAELKAGLRRIEDEIRRNVASKRNLDNSLATVQKNLDAAEAAAVAAQRSYRTALADHLRAENDVSARTSALAAARAALVDLRKRRNPHRETVVTLRKQISERENEKARATDALKEANWSLGAYSFWADAFRKMRLHIIDEVLSAIQHSAQKEAEFLGLHGWRLEFATERETQSGKTAHGFTCLLYPPGQIEPVRWEAYCGGEVQRWQLAARCALAELLLAYANVSPNLEVWDEPTQHMSAGGVENLLVCLRERALRLNRQILIVDHHVLADSFFDGKLTVWHEEAGAQIEDQRSTN